MLAPASILIATFHVIECRFWNKSQWIFFATWTAIRPTFHRPTLNWSNAIFFIDSLYLVYDVIHGDEVSNLWNAWKNIFFLISVGWSCKNFFFLSPPPLLWKEFLCKILKDEIQLHMEIWKLICSTKKFLQYFYTFRSYTFPFDNNCRIKNQIEEVFFQWPRIEISQRPNQLRFFGYNLIKDCLYLNIVW